MAQKSTRTKPKKGSRPSRSVASERPLVCVIDDDVSVRESLPDLLTQLGYATRTFESAEAFLASDAVTRARCLVLDVTMPGMSGPELQRQLTSRGNNVPVVFITGNKDETLRRALIAKGAIECLFKPFTEAALEQALKAAIPV